MKPTYGARLPAEAFRAAFALWLVAACRKAPSRECEQVLADPAHAMPRLSKHYPDDPVKVAETIEACVAPDGDECDRIEALVRAVPTMAPLSLGGLAEPGKVRDLCRTMSPAQRRCMFPSYVLAHTDECVQQRDALASISVSPARTPTPVPACDVPELVLDRGGASLHTKGATARLDGAFDPAWVVAKLQPLKQPDCSALTLKTRDGVAYQTSIDAMDAAIKAGFVDTGIDASIDPAPPLPARPGAGPPTDGRTGLAQAPVVIVTRTDVQVGGAPIATVAALGTGNARIEPLVAALAGAPGTLVILQADASTDAHVINRIVGTLHAAGFDNILFAVKNK